jgi:hypothetical protein
LTPCSGVTSVSLVTEGSLTLNQWSPPSGTVEVTFSSGAQLTGVAPTASGTFESFPVPVSGSFTAHIAGP